MLKCSFAIRFGFDLILFSNWFMYIIDTFRSAFRLNLLRHACALEFRLVNRCARSVLLAIDVLLFQRFSIL